MISDVVIPALAAADTEAPLVECALNMVVSIPALSRTERSHLAMVDDATGLCGLIVAMNCYSLCCSSVCLNCSVAFSYALSVTTGQSFSFCVKLEKKKSASGLFAPACLARPDAWKATPSGRYLLKRRSSCCKSANRVDLVSVMSITSFRVIVWSDNVEFFPKSSKYTSTWDTSHVEVYRGWGGLRLKTPLRRRVTRGCCPTASPSTLSCTDDIADL